MITEPIEFLQLFILILAIVFMGIAIEYRRLVYSVISFALGNSWVSITFFILGAPLVAVFNFGVFSIAVVIILLATINMESPEVEETTSEEAGTL